MEEGVSTLNPAQEKPDDSRRYVIGATLEVNLWRGLAVEADFLYRRNGFNERYDYFPGVLDGGGEPASINNHVRLDAFELPLLAKYYFRDDSNLQPFILTGYSLRKALTNVDSSIATLSNSLLSTQSSSFSYWMPVDVGASFGVGFRWRTGRIALKPEIRYTYWGAHPSIGVSKQQADVLVGIMF